jgi:hypothetical protein
MNDNFHIYEFGRPGSGEKVSPGKKKLAQGRGMGQDSGPEKKVGSGIKTSPGKKKRTLSQGKK